MGFISILLQIIVLRGLLTVFSGNELDIGITLSVWLVSVGAGSLAGSNLKWKHGFAFSFILISLLSIPTLAGIELIRPALGLEYGETVSLPDTFISTAIVLFPICFLIGLQFPLAVRATGPFCSPHGLLAIPGVAVATPGGVYGLEAAGAFAGGVLFTLVFSGRMETALLTAGVSLLGMAVSVYLLRGRSRPVLMALLTTLLIVPLLSHHAYKMIEPDLRQARSAGELVQKSNSRYGEIWVTRLEGQFNIYWAGHLMYSYPDSRLEELRVHLPMTMHQSPVLRVLAIGGSTAMAREFIKYPLVGLDFIEMDPALLQTSVALLSPEDLRAVEDDRVNLIPEDGRRFIKSASASYDIIVLNLSEPSTASINRFYTAEFFKEARAALKQGGLISLSLPVSAGYISRRMQLANGSVFNALKSAFKYVAVSTEEYGMLVASESPIESNPIVLKERFRVRAISTVFFYPYIIDDAFLPLRARAHRGRLDAAGVINTDMKPAAYLYNLMLWAETHGGHSGRSLSRLLGLGRYNVVLAIGVFLFLALFALKRKRRTLNYSIFTTGYAGMALMVAVLLGYQSSYGYVYEMVGLLTALFMAGAAIGTYLLRGLKNKPMRGLLFLEIGFSLFAALTPVLFHGAALYHISLLAGIFTGCGFRAVSLQVEEGVGGRLYAFEIFGSFAGAALTAVVVIPIIGIGGALYLVAAVKGLSAGAVSSIIRE